MDLKKEYCRYCGADITSYAINVLAHPFKGDEYLTCPSCGKQVLRPLILGDYSYFAIFCIIGPIALVLFALVFVIFRNYFLK